MKTILLALLLSFNIFAQGEFIIMLSGSGTGGTNRDSVPNSYANAFHDSIDAAVSTEILSNGIVLAGFDSAYVNVVGGDYRIGALGDTTRLATLITLGDTLWAIDTSSATNSVKTNVVFTIGGVVDTFSVTTVAASNDYLTTDLLWYWDDEDLSNGSINSWADKEASYTLSYPADTSKRPIMTTGGLVFGANDYLAFADTIDLSGTLSFEFVIEINDSTTDQSFFGWDNGVAGTALTFVTWSTAGKVGAWADNASSEVSTRVEALGFIGMKHVVVTYDGTNVPKIYLNGVQQSRIGTTAKIFSGTNQVAIGWDAQELNAGTIYRLIRVYERELSLEEIQGNYASTSVTGKLP